MILEFAGLPGAGKSTLCCHVARELAERRVQGFLGEAEALRASRAGELESRLRLLRSFVRIGRSRPATYRSWRRYARRYARISPLYDCCLAGTLCLLDDGMFQLMVGLCVNSRFDIADAYHLLLGHAACPILVVIVNAPAEVVEVRKRRRGRHDDHLQFTVRELAVVRDLKQTLPELAEREAHLSLLLVDADSDEAMERAVELVTSRVLHQLAHSAAATRPAVTWIRQAP